MFYIRTHVPPCKPDRLPSMEIRILFPLVTLILVSREAMGRSDKKAKAPLRRAVSESAAPSRGQRKRALKKASLISKIGLSKRSRESPKVGCCLFVLRIISL